MPTNLQTPSELKTLDDAYTAAHADAQALIANLTEDQAAWRPHPAAWSVAECLDHLAATNRIYIRAMQPVADQARRENKLRRRPALPGFLGAWFVRTLEPPAKIKTKSPKSIKPRTAPTLADASAAFLSPLTPKLKISSAPTPISISPRSSFPIHSSRVFASLSPPAST